MMRRHKRLAMLALGAILIATGVGVGIIAYDLVRYRIGVYYPELPPVAGYAERYSFTRGEAIDLYIHTTAPSKLYFLRLAEEWQSVGDPLPVPPQTQSNRLDRVRGMTWNKNLSVASDGLPAGLYQFVVQQADDAQKRFSIPIIIKEENPPDVAVVLNTNTWDAYNTFGGMSHYEFEYMNYLTSVLLDMYVYRVRGANFKWRMNKTPSRRPNGLYSAEVNSAKFGENYSSYLVRNEIEFLVFLARQGYSFAVYADEDVATDPFLRKAKVQIAPGHAEYWTDDMFYGLERYIEAGGRVFRSISGMEERVLRTGFGLKYEHAMPRAQINELVGAFTDGEGGFTAAPYRALCTEHWIFAGTGLKPGDLFGEDSANHPSFNIPGHQHYADMVDLKGQPTRGASGFFTSKTGRGSGQFSRLARGTNPQGGADMVYRPTASGGWIFNAGSLTFTGALFRDEAISRIVRNLLDEAISPVPLPRQEPRCL